MPLAGQGMLLTSMDIDPSDENEFNQWYDREHLAERVGIEGFLEARRYIAHEAAPKYLCLYSTRTFETLDSAAYKNVLARQTEWSNTNIARFRNMIRSVARVTVSAGQGRGSALAMIRIRPGDRDTLRADLRSRLDPGQLDGIISMHLLEGDPGLSKPLTDPPGSVNPGAGDWFALIEGTGIDAVTKLMHQRFATLDGGDSRIVTSGTYHLMWNLAKSDL